MRDYAKILPQFWIGKTGREIRALGMETQLVALYLLSCPQANMIGVYYLPKLFIVHETGLSIDAVTKALQNLIDISFCSYDESLEYIWVHEMALYQISDQLKPNDNRVKGINELYLSLPKLKFLQAFFEKYQKLLCLSAPPTPFEAPSKEGRCIPRINLTPLRSQEQEQEQEQEKEQEQDQEQKKEKIFMSGKPDVDSLKINFNFAEGTQRKKKLHREEMKSHACEILEFLNDKTGRAYRPVEANLKLIVARLESGASVMDCRQVIAKKSREWREDPKMAEYLRPATLFNATKFEQYLGELVLPKEESHENN